MNFCFQTSSTKFRDLAAKHGVSPSYMDYLASDYAIRNGLGEREMLDIMYGDQRKKSSKEFAAFLAERALDDLAESYTTKNYLGKEETVNRLPKIGWSNPIYDRLNDLRTLYQGRPVDSVPDDELELVKAIFPVWKTAQGADGVERLVLMMPEVTADRIIINGVDYSGYVPHYMDFGEYWLVRKEFEQRFYGEGERYDFEKALADGDIVTLKAGEYQRYRDVRDIDNTPDPLDDHVGWWQTFYRSESLENLVTALDRIAKRRIDAMLGPEGEGVEELSRLLGVNAESAAAYAQMHQARQGDRVKARRGGKGYLDDLGPTAVAARRGVELTEVDKRYLAELTAAQFSTLVDRLMAPGAEGDGARAYYLGLRTGEENAEVLGMTRKAFIQRYGVSRLMGMVRDMVIDHNPSMSVDASIRVALFNRNWEANMRYASHTLIENEEFSLKDLYVGREQLYDDIREADDVLLEYYSNGDVDSLGKPDTAISTISHVSRRMRRFLATAEMFDKSGRMIMDSRGYGVQAHTDGRNALNYFYDLLGGCADLDEMTGVLRGVDSPMCDAMLRQIASDPNFASDVVTLFRQNRMDFGITEAYMGDDGVLHYRNRSLSRDMVARKLQSDIEDRIMTGCTRLFRLPEDTTTSFGRGTVDVETFDAAMKALDGLLKDYGSGRELSDQKAYDDMRRLVDVLGALGFGASGVDMEVLRDALYEPEGAAHAPEQGKGYRFVLAVRDLLDCFNAPEGGEILLPFASESSEGASKEQAAQVALRKVCDMLVPYMRKRMELMVDANGQRRYVIGLNRYMGDFMKSVDISTPAGKGKAADFLNENFTSFQFFNPTKRESDIPRAMWWRSALETQMGFHENISFNGAEYGGMSGVTYISNMLAEYFGAEGRDKGIASYAFSSGSRDLNGFITQRFYRMGEYEVNGVRHVGSEEILDGLMHLALMDLQRMRSVALRSGELVKSVTKKEDGTYSVEFYSDEKFRFDCTDPTVGRKAKEASDSGSGNLGLVREDLVRDGRMAHSGTGLAFRMLRFLNSEITGVDGGMTDLGIMMMNYINTGKVEVELAAALRGRLATQMDEHVASETGKLEREGLYGRQKARVRYGAGKDGRALYVNADGLRFLDSFISETPEETMSRAMAEAGTVFGGKPDAGVLRRYAEMRRALADDALREFIWNDYFARSQSFLITAGDPAQFKDAADMYKRMLGITSPGRTSNEYATDFNGNRVSDGFYRCGYIANNMRLPTARESVLALADRAIEMADEAYRKAMAGDEKSRAEAAVILRKKNYLQNVKRGKLDGLYGKELDTTEGQSWTSPTGMRKKLFGIGAMEVSLEQAFQRIRRGDYSYDDIIAMFQVLKPVVVTHERARYCEGGDGMREVKNFTYHKTAEVMLALSGAAVKGDPSLSVLEAMYEFMEESHYDADGHYRTDGIDTLLGESSVKGGPHKIVHIDGSMTKAEAKEALRKGFYNDDGTYTEAVHKIPVREYRVQQENPAHFHDHEMNLPTQVRPQAISDIEMAGEYLVRIKNEDGVWVTQRVTGKQISERYWGLLSDNIRDSVREFKRAFGLDAKTEVEANREMSARLLEYCEKSAEYGPDMFYALSLDENREFNVPPDDYVTGMKFQNLVNSYMRDYVSMQKVPGGPVVQTSSFGMSDRLSIRFKDAEGKSLMTFREFFNANAPDGMRFDDAQMHRDPASSGRYEEVRREMAERYITSVLGKHRNAEGKWVGGVSSLDHIEAYLNIPTKEMREALFVRKGTELAKKYPDQVGQFLTVEQALKEGIINDEMLKCIASRVPVEDKYSMLPIKIVGFMSYAGGELIVLPDEVTLLTGCDFDVDKLFVMTKSFTAHRSIESPAAAVALAERYVAEAQVTDEDVRRAADEHYAAGKASKIRGEAYEESLPTIRKALEESAAKRRAKEVKHVAEMFEKIAAKEFYVASEEDRALEDFFRENYDGGFKYRFEEDTGGSRNGRNNEVFDLMWSTMTSEHNMDKLFDPGGFDNVKRMTNIMKIMSLPDYAEDCRRPAGARRYGTYEELLTKPLRTLEDMLSNGEDYDPFALSTAVHFQRENVGGRRMVGWTANNVTAHAFLSPLGLRLNPKGSYWTSKLFFGGKRLSDVRIDPMVGDTGEYVSRTLSSYLAASVDSPKYETLSALNFNQFTGNAYMFLLRCGFDERLVTAFMSLPSIRELARIYEVECHDRGFVTVDDVVERFKRERCGGANDPYVRDENGEYRVRAGFAGFDSSNGGVVFDMAQLTSVFEGGRGSEYVNYSAVDLFRELRVLGDELSHISSLTKLNTLKGAPGSTLGDILVYAQRVTKYLDKYVNTENNRSLFDPEVVRRIIDSNPVLKEFYESFYAQSGYVNTYGERAVGLAEMIYSRYTPNYNPKFTAALRSLQNGKGGSLSAEQINEYAASFTKYALFAQDGNDVFTPRRQTYVKGPDGKGVRTEMPDYFVRQDGLGFVARVRDAIMENSAKGPEGRNAFLSALFIAPPNESCPVMTVWADRRGLSETACQDLREGWLLLYRNRSTRRLATDLFCYAMMQNGCRPSGRSLDYLVPAQMKHELLEYRRGITSPHGGADMGFEADSFYIKYLRNHTYDRTLVPRFYSTRDGDVSFERGLDGRTYARFGRDADLGVLRVRSEDIDDIYAVNGKSKVDKYADVVMIDGRVFVNVEADAGKYRYMETGKLGADGYFYEMDPAAGKYDASVLERYRDGLESHEVGFSPDPDADPAVEIDGRGVRRIEESVNWSLSDRASGLDASTYSAFGEIVKGDTVLKEVLETIASTEPKETVFAKQMAAVDKWMNGRSRVSRGRDGKPATRMEALSEPARRRYRELMKLFCD